jgi:hypothetical protein
LRSLPDSEVAVHLEPRREGLSLRDRALAAALAEPLVRDVHTHLEPLERPRTGREVSPSNDAEPERIPGWCCSGPGTRHEKLN